jgi:alpha-N-arabinofuranosidase
VPHQDATLLPLALDEGAYVFNGERLPAVSASASRDSTGRIHLTIANLDPRAPRTIRADVRGTRVFAVEGRILTAAAMNAHNTFDRPDAVRPAAFGGARLTSGNLVIDLPAKAIVALELRVH